MMQHMQSFRAIAAVRTHRMCVVNLSAPATHTNVAGRRALDVLRMIARAPVEEAAASAAYVVESYPQAAAAVLLRVRERHWRADRGEALRNPAVVEIVQRAVARLRSIAEQATPRASFRGPRNVSMDAALWQCVEQFCGTALDPRAPADLRLVCAEGARLSADLIVAHKATRFVTAPVFFAALMWWDGTGVPHAFIREALTAADGPCGPARDVLDESVAAPADGGGRDNATDAAWSAVSAAEASAPFGHLSRLDSRSSMPAMDISRWPGRYISGVSNVLMRLLQRAELLEEEVVRGDAVPSPSFSASPSSSTGATDATHGQAGVPAAAVVALAPGVDDDGAVDVSTMLDDPSDAASRLDARDAGADGDGARAGAMASVRLQQRLQHEAPLPRSASTLSRLSGIIANDVNVKHAVVKVDAEVDEVAAAAEAAATRAAVLRVFRQPQIQAASGAHTDQRPDRGIAPTFTLSAQELRDVARVFALAAADELHARAVAALITDVGGASAIAPTAVATVGDGSATYVPSPLALATMGASRRRSGGAGEMQEFVARGLTTNDVATVLMTLLRHFPTRRRAPCSNTSAPAVASGVGADGTTGVPEEVPHSASLALTSSASPSAAMLRAAVTALPVWASTAALLDQRSSILAQSQPHTIGILASAFASAAGQQPAAGTRIAAVLRRVLLPALPADEGVLSAGRWRITPAAVVLGALPALFYNGAATGAARASPSSAASAAAAAAARDGHRRLVHMLCNTLADRLVSNPVAGTTMHLAYALAALQRTATLDASAVVGAEDTGAGGRSQLVPPPVGVSSASAAHPLLFVALQRALMAQLSSDSSVLLRAGRLKETVAVLTQLAAQGAGCEPLFIAVADAVLVTSPGQSQPPVVASPAPVVVALLRAFAQATNTPRPQLVGAAVHAVRDAATRGDSGLTWHAMADVLHAAALLTRGWTPYEHRATSAATTAGGISAQSRDDSDVSDISQLSVRGAPSDAGGIGSVAMFADDICELFRIAESRIVGAHKISLADESSDTVASLTATPLLSAELSPDDVTGLVRLCIAHDAFSVLALVGEFSGAPAYPDGDAVPPSRPRLLSRALEREARRVYAAASGGRLRAPERQGPPRASIIELGTPTGGALPFPVGGSDDTTALGTSADAARASGRADLAAATIAALRRLHQRVPHLMPALPLLAPHVTPLGCAVDAAWPAANVVLDVHGPRCFLPLPAEAQDAVLRPTGALPGSHYAVTPPAVVPLGRLVGRRRTPSVDLKARLLAAAGYRVVTLRFDEWEHAVIADATAAAEGGGSLTRRPTRGFMTNDAFADASLALSAVDRLLLDKLGAPMTHDGV